ncbi:MAG: uroporphyrinogen decarboxylase family protein [Terracidiphilus sp.]
MQKAGVGRGGDDYRGGKSWAWTRRLFFADLLLPLEPMGLDFEFQAGEGPVVHKPLRTAADVRALRTDRVNDLAYVAQAIEKVAAHFRDRLGVIGFCGAPFTAGELHDRGRRFTKLHPHKTADV